ncbi:uncharacterized protein [Procambarus clarkii]|uniref:uncharacterized protein n=1 Tax=Procambarus clarkii TaxID=6728 RepID=UPI001E677812|nr:uncharacterized protein LOC123747295 [Procambarus clarkii]
MSASSSQLRRQVAKLQQYVYRLLYGDMLAHMSRYPLRLPMRMIPGGRGGQTMHQDRFIGSGAAILVGLGLCISSFSLKKLSAMPDRPTRLI